MNFSNNTGWKIRRQILLQLQSIDANGNNDQLFMNHYNMHHLRHPSGLEYTMTMTTLEEGRLLVAEKEGRYLEALSMPEIGNHVYLIESEDKIAVIAPTETLIYSPAQGYFLQRADYEREQAMYKVRTTKRILTEYPAREYYTPTIFPKFTTGK